jgi:hypothetical protein
MKMESYALPMNDDSWTVQTASMTTRFDWDYADNREKMTNLYQKGKDRQWDASKRIDWTRPIDPDNPLGVPDSFIPISSSRVWDKLTSKEKATVRRHMAAWQFSQFLHGEQGALICTAKIVQTVPDIDAKYYAGTQVMDEARHVETYSRYIREKLEMAYPINPNLATLLNQIVSDARWDFTYLGMQVLIEGVALAAFGLIRDYSKNALAASVNAYVMQDEARHVAFGRLALRDYYPHLTQKERDEREEFAVEGCYLLRDRFLGHEVWETLGLPVDECTRHVDQSEMMKVYRTSLFTRIVPTMKEIGLWGPRIQKAYADMGIIGFADTDVEALSAHDEEVGESFDRRREIERIAALGAADTAASAAVAGPERLQ